MTVTAINSVPSRVEYSATASQTVFTFPFPIFEESELAVFQKVGGGDPDPSDVLVLTEDYTITNEGENGGGYITLTTGAASGDVIAIDHNMNMQRAAQFTVGGPIEAPVLEYQLNVMAAKIKQLDTLKADRYSEDTPKIDGRLVVASGVSSNEAVNRGQLDAHAFTVVTSDAPVVTSITAAKALTTISNGAAVFVTGYLNAYDGGGGMYHYDSGSSATANDGTILALDTLAGRLHFVGTPTVQTFGAICDATINASGTLSGTDDTTAIQAALDAAETSGYSLVRLPKSTRITSQVTIPDGVTLEGFGSHACPVYRIGTGYERTDEGPTIFVDFGSGSSDRDDGAIRVRNRSCISGVSFWYAGQDMNATTPTVFAPTIVVHETAHAATIRDINLGNAYEGINALWSHTRLTVSHVVGFPLAYGLRLGSSGDNPNVRDVHFQPLYAFRGTIAGSNLSTWVSANGIAFDLRRSSWGVWSNLFAYGYNYGIFATYASSDTFITDGGVESGHFMNCSFDSCYYGMWFEHGSGTGNVHWGCHFENCFFVSNDPNDASRVTGVGFTWDADRTGGAALSSFDMANCKFHGSDSHCMDITNAYSFKIEAYFQEWGAVTSGTGIRLTNCDSFVIDANMDGQADSGRTGIDLISDNSDGYITGIYRDFADTIITIRNDSNTTYTLGEGIKLDTTGTEVSDLQGDALRGRVTGGAPQVLTGAGAVDVTSDMTHVVTTGADALTLADGVEGQEKHIVMITDGGNGTLTPSNLGNGTNLTFDDVGDSAFLKFTNGNWYFMGGTATLA